MTKAEDLRATVEGLIDAIRSQLNMAAKHLSKATDEGVADEYRFEAARAALGWVELLQGCLVVDDADSDLDKPLALSVSPADEEYIRAAAAIDGKTLAEYVPAVVRTHVAEAGTHGTVAALIAGERARKAMDQ